MSLGPLFQRASAQASSADFGGLPGAIALVDGDTAGAVQARLNQLGVQPQLTVDRSWGPKSAAALASVQSAKGLTPDGIPGPQTLAMLGIPLPTPSKGPSVPGLKASVVTAFPTFNGKFEGEALPFAYTDSKSLVTVGTGNLIDAGPAAAPGATSAPQPWNAGPMLQLAWQRPDGSPAGSDEVTAAFNTLKAAWPGVQSVACKNLTTIRLSKKSLDDLLYGKMEQNHHYLSSAMPGYTDAPADAQLGTHSLSWAWGPGFAHVWGALGQEFKGAMAAANYAAIPDIITRASAHEESINPGIRSRNAATKALFQNAADVAAKKANPDVLYFPGPVVAGVVSALNTLPWVLAGVTVAAGILTLVLTKWGGKS